MNGGYALSSLNHNQSLDHLRNVLYYILPLDAEQLLFVPVLTKEEQDDERAKVEAAGGIDYLCDQLLVPIDMRRHLGL